MMAMEMELVQQRKTKRREGTNDRHEKEKHVGNIKNIGRLMKLQQQIKKEKKRGKGKLVGIQGMKMGEGDT
jgi:hypothetical protein